MPTVPLRVFNFLKVALLVLASLLALFWAQEARAEVSSEKIFLNANRVLSRMLDPPATAIALEIADGDFVEVQVQEDDVWSDWLRLAIDNDASPWERHTQLLTTADATAVRVRSAIATQANLHAIAVDKDPTVWEEAAGRRLPAPVIVPRWQWGASESLRFSKRGARDIERLFNDSDPYLADRIRNCDRRAYLYPEEFRATSRKFIDEEGNALAWPQGYSPKINLIVLHHTAESSPRSSRRSGIERMRSIYEYHTVVRGWGDIGYNFVIDPDGNIYEGRAGGDYVVGAHAYCNNVGTVGIALMGNFQNSRPSDEQLTGLRWLIAHLSYKYGIDPTARTIYHGKTMPTIVGHRDVGQTACPGQYSQELLPQIRLAVQERDPTRPLFSSFAPASTQNEAALMASLEPLKIPMGKQEQLKVEFMNVGLDTWNEKTWLLAKGDTGIYFTEYRPYSFVAGFLQEDFVPPGEIGSFTINLQGGLSEQSGTVDLIPVVNNDRRLVNNTAELAFAITGGSPRFTHVTSYFPSLHKTGEDLTGTVKIVNSGSVPWEKDSITEVDFYLEGGSGEVSVLNHPNRVEPGQQGSFRIRLQNIEEEGPYSRTLIPQFREGSPLIGSAMTITSRAEPIPAIAYASYRSHLVPLPSSRASRGRESTSEIATIEALAGTDLTLSPREQAPLPLRIRAGKNGVRKFQAITDIVRSNPLIVLRNENSVRMRNTFRSPVALRRFQTENITLTILAPRTPGEYTFSIGDIPFTLSVVPSARYTLRKSVPRRIITRRTASRETLRQRRRERRARRMRRAPPPPVTYDGPSIRIRLTHSSSTAILSSPSTLRIEGNGTIIFLKSGPVHLSGQQNLCSVVTGNGQFLASSIRIAPTNANAATTIMTIPKSTNRFRGTIECRMIDGKLTLINDLSLEDYLAGLAEEPDTEPYEKQRAFAIAARTYALFYVLGPQRKFPGKPYDGSDSPAEFQAYGGVYFQEQNPRWTDAVLDTKDRVLIWQRKVIKPPYFSSDNGRTKSAAEVWGWLNTPYLDAKDDPWCAGMGNWGHGVGMSGCGAEGQANEGKTAEEILQYYYPGTKIATYKPGKYQP